MSRPRASLGVLPDDLYIEPELWPRIGRPPARRGGGPRGPHHRLEEQSASDADRRLRRVVAAANGRTGLEAFRAHPPRVVLTDLLMPEQDGIGAILQMRRERPAARIVAMSGGGRIDKADYLTAAVKLGADAAVEKRDTDRLLKTVLGLLKSP